MKMNLSNQFQANSLVLEAKQRYMALSSRDQIAVKLLMILLVFVIAYFGIWRGAQGYLAEAKLDWQSEKQIFQELKEHEVKLRQIAQQARPNINDEDEQSLLTLVGSSAKQSGVTLQRFEPDSSSGGVRVTLTEVQFKQAIGWLYTLSESHQINVDDITIEKQSEAGIVNLRLTLTD